MARSCVEFTSPDDYGDMVKSHGVDEKATAEIVYPLIFEEISAVLDEVKERGAEAAKTVDSLLTAIASQITALLLGLQVTPDEKDPDAPFISAEAKKAAAEILGRTPPANSLASNDEPKSGEASSTEGVAKAKTYCDSFLRDFTSLSRQKVESRFKKVSQKDLKASLTSSIDMGENLVRETIKQGGIAATTKTVSSRILVKMMVRFAKTNQSIYTSLIGDCGETLATTFAQNEFGFTPTSYQKRNIRGIDCLSRDEKGKLVVIESKALHAHKGSSGLGKNTDGTPQMSIQWIRKAATKMKTKGSSYHSEENKVLGEDILTALKPTGEGVRRILVETDLKSSKIRAYEAFVEGSKDVWKEISLFDLSKYI